MSRLEVNIRRLLRRCESMAKENCHLEDWRLEKVYWTFLADG